MEKWVTLTRAEMEGPASPRKMGKLGNALLQISKYLVKRRGKRLFRSLHSEFLRPQVPLL